MENSTRSLHSRVTDRVCWPDHNSQLTSLNQEIPKALYRYVIILKLLGLFGSVVFVKTVFVVKLQKVVNSFSPKNYSAYCSKTTPF